MAAKKNVVTAVRARAGNTLTATAPRPTTSNAAVNRHTAGPAVVASAAVQGGVVLPSIAAMLTPAVGLLEPVAIMHATTMPSPILEAGGAREPAPLAAIIITAQSAHHNSTDVDGDEIGNGTGGGTLMDETEDGDTNTTTTNNDVVLVIHPSSTYNASTSEDEILAHVPVDINTDVHVTTSTVDTEKTDEVSVPIGHINAPTMVLVVSDDAVGAGVRMKRAFVEIDQTRATPCTTAAGGAEATSTTTTRSSSVESDNSKRRARRRISTSPEPTSSTSRLSTSTSDIDRSSTTSTIASSSTTSSSISAASSSTSTSTKNLAQLNDHPVLPPNTPRFRVPNRKYNI